MEKKQNFHFEALMNLIELQDEFIMDNPEEADSILANNFADHKSWADDLWKKARRNSFQLQADQNKAASLNLMERATKLLELLPKLSTAEVTMFFKTAHSAGLGMQFNNLDELTEDVLVAIFDDIKLLELIEGIEKLES